MGDTLRLLTLLAAATMGAGLAAAEEAAEIVPRADDMSL